VDDDTISVIKIRSEKEGASGKKRRLPEKRGGFERKIRLHGNKDWVCFV